MPITLLQINIEQIINQIIQIIQYLFIFPIRKYNFCIKIIKYWAYLNKLIIILYQKSYNQYYKEVVNQFRDFPYRQIFIREMKTRGQFSKPTPFNYQSHQSLQKFRKVPVQQRTEQVVQDIFKIKLKGEHNSKLIAARNLAPSKQQEIKQLKKQMKIMEGELKKKILENPLLSRIFKTKQFTTGQLSHLDLYLMFVKLKEEQQNTQKQFQETLESYKKREIAYELQISKIKDQKEEGEQSFITQIQKATEKFELLQQQFQKKLMEKQKLFEQETIERETKIQDSFLIMEEMKRKNHKLTKDNKDLQMKLNQYKKSQQQRIKNLKFQFESHKQKTEQERTKNKDQIQSLKRNLKSLQSNSSSEIKSLQNGLAEKTLQIQELDRFIELEKESFQSQIHQLENSYEEKMSQERNSHQEQYMKIIEKTETQFMKSIQQVEQKLKQTTLKYQGQSIKLKQLSRNNIHQISQLQALIQQKMNYIKKIHDQTKKYKLETDTQIQQLKSSNKFNSNEKQNLTKKLIQAENKLEKLSKENQLIIHQKNSIQLKYQKGFFNTQNDIKQQQSIIDQLQRKIYMLGNQNTGLKKSLEEKTYAENKTKESNRMNEQTYQEKYKAIGRIEQIRHKLQNYLMGDLTQGYFNNSLLNSTNKYRSNNSDSSAISLIESIQGLTLIMDKICQSYSSLNQSFQTFRKQKIQDQREIESLLNHFIDMGDKQEELQELLISYINVRKEVFKQSTTGAINCEEEYLHEKRRQISQYLIEKLIQLKVIKQYSSVDQSASSYRNGDKFQNNQGRYQQNVNFNSGASTTHFMSASNSRNSRKSLKKLVQQEHYRSNNNVFAIKNREQFEMINARDNMRDSLQIDQRTNLSKTIQSSNNKSNRKIRFNQRLSTQPTKEDDVEEQSTYEIMDENIDYGNLKKGYSSKLKLIQNYGSGNQTAQKHHLNKKYKQQIKEKLLYGKNKRQTNFPLSKEDIEKKYFIR